MNAIVFILAIRERTFVLSFETKRMIVSVQFNTVFKLPLHYSGKVLCSLVYGLTGSLLVGDVTICHR